MENTKQNKKAIPQNQKINSKIKQQDKHQHINNIAFKKAKFTNISPTQNRQDLQLDISDTVIQNHHHASITPYNQNLKQKQTKQCVICLEEGELINPCSCSGQYHKKCLINWIQRRRKNKLQFRKCEVCLEFYQIRLFVRLQFSLNKLKQSIKNPTCIFLKETVKLLLIILVTLFMFAFIFLFEFNQQIQTQILRIVSVEKLTVCVLIVVIWVIIFGICALSVRQYYLEYCTQQKLELKQNKQNQQNNQHRHRQQSSQNHSNTSS